MFLSFTFALHCRRKQFSRYFLQAFSTKEKLSHIKSHFKINGKETIIMPKKANLLNSKTMKEKGRHRL